MHRVLKLFAPLSLEVVAVIYDVNRDNIEALVNTFRDKGLYVTCLLSDKVFTGALESEEFSNYVNNQFQEYEEK